MNYKITYSDDYLAHHGVLGMKWGIWNEDTSSRYFHNPRRKPKTIDEKKAEWARDPKKLRKHEKYYNNQEMRQAIERLQLMRQVDDLDDAKRRRGSNWINNKQQFLLTTAKVAIAGIGIAKGIYDIRKMARSDRAAVSAEAEARKKITSEAIDKAVDAVVGDELGLLKILDK